jgi:ABC-type polysaccharide/polyol phosphate transport system ATPase subunit
MAAIRFDEVSKRYPRGDARYRSLREDLGQRLRLRRPRGRKADEGGPLALDHLSLDIAEGESFGIVGPNGAGKTTALKLISRISFPTGGRLRVRGRVSALIDVTAGVHPELTGRENIWLYGQILGMGKADIRRRFDEIVEFAELPHALDMPAKFYSSGMLLRLGFSIASHLDPEIFVVDEALAVGDAGFQAKCVERMSELVASGRTLVLVSHYLPAIETTCTRGLFLRDGRAQFVGPVSDVLKSYFSWLDSADEELEHDGIPERRSRYAVLEDAGLYTTAGERSRVFKTGDDIEVRIRVRSLRPLPRPHVNIGIKDHRPGNLIFCSMLVDGGAPDEITGTVTISCRLHDVPLLPRAYEVWIAIDSETAHEYLEWQPIASFRVGEALEPAMGPASQTNLALGGPIHVPHDWEVA